MIVQCPDCTSRYQLDPDRVPRKRIRVRCPNCRFVFPIDGTLADRSAVTDTGVSAPVAPVRSEVRAEQPSIGREPVSAPVPPAAPIESTRVAPAPQADAPMVTHGFDLEIERHGATPPPPSEAPSFEPSEPAIARSGASAAVKSVTGESAPVSTRVSAPVAPAAPKADPADALSASDKKARRLARALVSDILVYNRDLRDQALANGTLVQSLGHEIKKSFELFKERVGDDVENPRRHFVEALNDILADGQKVF